ncbi:MAG: fibronectin type III domain-containing protein, partial [Acidimicrobiales bacterium]|nr:fibronectin type III domain-containing protein [Acidimicrobiales bacterium]
MMPKKISVRILLTALLVVGCSILLTALLAVGCSTSSDPVAEPTGSSTTAETTTTSVQEAPTTTASPADGNEEPSAPTTTETPPEAPESPQTPTTTEGPRFSDAEVLAQEYGWFATGAEVEALQTVLEVAVDGIYGQATLDAHREALINAGLPVDHLPSVQAPDAPTTVQAPDAPTTVQAPDAPTSVAATSMNNAVSTVSWAAPANNGSVIFQYIVEYSTDGTTWVEAGIVDASVVSLIINGLTNGTDYTFRVKAENSYGTSATGLSLAARPGDNPDTPTGLTASNRSNATSTVSWAAPGNNGYPITDYLIEYSTDGSTWTAFVDGVSTTTNVAVTGLANGTAYTFRVSAVNAVGTSPTGSSSSITTAGPPQAPEGLYATYYDGAASTLTWSSPSHDGGLAVTDYVVEYSTDATTWVIFDDGVLAATTATVVGLANGTAYTFRVSAVNELGTGTTDTTSAQTATSTQLAAGGEHTCALLGNGAVKCWGQNYDGQLGYGDTNRRGDEAGEMGDNLPAIDLGTGRTATQITAGGEHTCALLDNATVKCWGSGYLGRLGYGDTNSRGDGAGEMGD